MNDNDSEKSAKFIVQSDELSTEGDERKGFKEVSFQWKLVFFLLFFFLGLLNNLG